MIEYCAEHKIDVEASASKPYSMDRNLWHISYEAGILEDPWFDPTTPENRGMYKLTVDPELAPDTPQYLELTFEKGNCVAIDGNPDSPAEIIRKLNKIAGEHGIGRVDLVENRFVGMKSRGVYETPGGTVLLHAHRQLETLTMDRDLMHLRDSLIPRYGELIYYGFWYALKGSPPGIDRPKPVHDFGDGSPETLQGWHHYGRAKVGVFPLRRGHCLHGRR